MFDVSRLHNELNRQNIPVVGVSESDGGRVDYAPEATAEQRATGDSLLVQAIAGIKFTAELRAEERADIATASMATIEDCPVCYAILNDGDLSKYTSDEIQGALVMLTRWLYNQDGIAVEWTLRARS